MSVSRGRLLLSVSGGGGGYFSPQKNWIPFFPDRHRTRSQEGPMSTVSPLHLTRGKSNPSAETRRDLGPAKGLEGRKRRSTIPRAECETPVGTGFGLQARSGIPGELRRKQLLKIPLVRLLLLPVLSPDPFPPFSRARRTTYLAWGVPATLCSRPSGRRSGTDPSCSPGPAEPGERRLLRRDDAARAALAPKGRDQTLP